MHPVKIRTTQGGRKLMRGMRKGGFIGPLLGAALPLLAAATPSIIDRVWPHKAEGRRRKGKRKGGLAAPYGGGKRKGGKCGAGAFTPGPLA